MEVANPQQPAFQPDTPTHSATNMDASMDIDMDIDLGPPPEAEAEPIAIVSGSTLIL